MNPIWTPQLLRSLTQLANIHVASVLHDFHVVPGTQDNKNLVSISFTFCKPEPLLSKPHKSPSTIRYNTKRRALRLQRQKGNYEGFHHSHPIIPSHSDSEIISQDKISESVSSLSTDSPADITSSNVVSTTTINTPMTISHSSASSANFPEVKTLTSSNSMKTGPNSSKPSPIINNNSSQQPLLIPNTPITSSTKIIGVDSKSTSISSTTISQSNNSQSTISHHDNAQMDITMGGHKRARSPSPSPPLLVPATTNSAAAAAAAIKIPAALSPEGGSRQVSHLVTLPNSHIEHKTTADPSRLLLLQDKNNNNSSRTIPIGSSSSTRPSIPIPTSNIFDVLSSSSTSLSSSSPQSQPPTSTTTASRLPPLPRRAPEQRSSSAQSILSAITATTTTTTTPAIPTSSIIIPVPVPVPTSASPLSYQKRRHLFSQFIFKLFIPLKLSDDTVKSMVQYHWESFIVYPHFNRPVNESDTIDKFSKHLQSSFNRPVRRMGHPPRIIRALNELRISFMDLLQPSPTPTPTPTSTQ